MVFTHLRPTLSSSTWLVLRHQQTARQPLRLITQRRHARVQDGVRFVTTQQPSAAVLEKYRAKLEQKARQEGLTSVSELKQAYKDRIEQVRKEAAAVAPHPPPPPPPQGEQQQQQQQQQQTLQQTPPPPPTPTAQSPGEKTGIKPLSSYIDVAKVAALPAKEIEYIWRLRFASDPLSLCAVVPLSTYQRMQATARRHPQFVLPMPRPDAVTEGEATATPADVHFLQWAFHPPATPTTSTPAAAAASTSNTHTSTVIFTHLAAFKLHGAYAQPHTTITHHLDLADSHGIVLLNGGVVDGRGVSADQGRWLLMCLQRFYDLQGGLAAGRDRRQGLLDKFTRGDAAFSLDELVAEAERMG